MAEKKGFLRKIFSFGSSSEEERMPEHGTMPRPSDTEIGREDAPDPDARPVAAAHTTADAEAGASDADNGSVTPVDEMGAAREPVTAKKKTATRSNWR